jgi:hypothetical protein
MNILFILNVLMLIASKRSENILLITKGFNFRNLIAAVKIGFRKI